MSVQQADSASIRAFSSLTRRDVDAVRATIRSVAKGHAIQEHDDYDGYLSLLITSPESSASTFVVAGTTRSVSLSTLWGDDMTEIGTFPSIGAAMLVLRQALERSENGAQTPTAAVAAFQFRHGDDAPLLAALRADARPDEQRWPAVMRSLDPSEDRA